MCSKKVRLGNTISEKLNLLFTGCVWEAGNPGLLGRLAPNLVEKVLEADKGRNIVVKASKLFSDCISYRRTCSDAECTELKEREQNIETLAYGAVQMDKNCNPHACPSMEMTKANKIAFT